MLSLTVASCGWMGLQTGFLDNAEWAHIRHIRNVKPNTQLSWLNTSSDCRKNRRKTWPSQSAVSLIGWFQGSRQKSCDAHCYRVRRVSSNTATWHTKWVFASFVAVLKNNGSSKFCQRGLGGPSCSQNDAWSLDVRKKKDARIANKIHISSTGCEVTPQTDPKRHQNNTKVIESWSKMTLNLSQTDPKPDLHRNQPDQTIPKRHQIRKVVQRVPRSIEQKLNGISWNIQGSPQTSMDMHGYQ